MIVDQNRGGSNPRKPWRSGLWLLVPLLPIAAYLLLAEHRVHLFGQLPYALAGVVLVAVVVGLVTGRRDDP